MASASMMCEPEHLKPVLWDDIEGWGGEGGTRGVQDGYTDAPTAGFMSMYGKTHHNIVK